MRLTVAFSLGVISLASLNSLSSGVKKSETGKSTDDASTKTLVSPAAPVTHVNFDPITILQIFVTAGREGGDTKEK